MKKWYRVSVPTPRQSVRAFALCDRISQGRTCELGLFSFIVQFEESKLSLLSLTCDSVDVYEYGRWGQVIRDLEVHRRVGDSSWMRCTSS